MTMQHPWRRQNTFGSITRKTVKKKRGGKSLLRISEVLEIRRLYETGTAVVALARKFVVSKSAIYNIISGANYRWLSPEANKNGAKLFL